MSAGWDRTYIWWIAPYLLTMATLFAIIVRSLHVTTDGEGELTTEELGFVAAGPRRALQVAVGRLATVGAARATSAPESPIMIVADRLTSPLELAASSALGSGLPFDDLLADHAVRTALRQIGDDLARRGLLHRPPSRRVALIMSRGMPGLWLLGWCGIAFAGATNGPVAFLAAIQLAVAAGGSIVIQRRYCTIPSRTLAVMRNQRRKHDGSLISRVALEGPAVLGATDPHLVAYMVRAEREAALSNPLL